MRRFAIACAIAVVGLVSAAAAGTLDDVKKRGMLYCGANGQRRGSASRMRRATGGDSTSTTAVPSRRRSSTIPEGEVRRADRQGPLHGAAVGRHRRARRARPPGPPRARHSSASTGRHQLLRRPGLHRAQGPQASSRRSSSRRDRVRRTGDDHRAQSRGLFPREQDAAQERHLRDDQ